MRAKEAGNEARARHALERALELFDLTIADDRGRGPRRRAICRAREVVCDFVAGRTTTVQPLYRSTVRPTVRDRCAKDQGERLTITRTA